MTRKQALSLAIQALCANGELEAAEVLRSLAADLPFVRWSDDAIHDTIGQYILDNGKIPNSTAFKSAGMPPHTVIRHRYHQNLRSWLDENYPSPTPDHTADTAAFAQEYQRIQASSGKDYNRRRDPRLRCWETIAKCNKVEQWRELLDTLNLPHYPPKRTLLHTSFQVHVHPHYDFKD